jgi:hypothetical protein
MTLLEPAVALTDLGIAIECGVFAGILSRGPNADRTLGHAFRAFFAASSVAALLGFVTHGFLPDDGSLLYRMAWTASIASIGVAALASWIIGGRLTMSHQVERIVILLAGVMFAIYLVVILFLSQSYVVVIVYYLPAAIFLLAAFSIAYRQRGDNALLAGAAGVILTFVAAGVQQGVLGLHFLDLNHNTAYHIVQAVAFFLIFWAARGILRRKAWA